MYLYCDGRGVELGRTGREEVVVVAVLVVVGIGVVRVADALSGLLEKVLGGEMVAKGREAGSGVRWLLAAAATAFYDPDVRGNGTQHRWFAATSDLRWHRTYSARVVGYASTRGLCSGTGHWGEAVDGRWTTAVCQDSEWTSGVAHICRGRVVARD